MTQNYEIRKAQRVSNSSTICIVLPKDMCMNLGIGKGDYVKISKNGNKIIVEKTVE